MRASSQRLGDQRHFLQAPVEDRVVQRARAADRAAVEPLPLQQTR